MSDLEVACWCPDPGEPGSAGESWAVDCPQHGELARIRHAYATVSHEVEQILGKALGYPVMGPELFEAGVPSGDVCVGDHVPQSLAAEAGQRIAELTLERDLAVAHDRQPYPTADAYDNACAALQKHHERADQAEADRDRARDVAVALEQELAEVAKERDHLKAALEEIDDTATCYPDSADEMRRYARAALALPTPLEVRP